MPAAGPADLREQIGAQGYLTDINGNGWPEIAAWGQYCLNGCLDYGVIDTAFFELQPDGSWHNLTAGVPGLIDPFYQFVVAGVPGSLVAMNKVGWDKLNQITTSHFFIWDGEQFVENSAEYADWVTDWGESLADEVRAELGQPIDDWRLEFHRILRQYDVVGLRAEGLALFLKLTELNNWPGTDFHFRCWLQVSRTMAQEEMATGQPFSIGPYEAVLGDGGYPDVCEGLGE